MPNDRQRRQVRCTAQQFATREADNDLYIDGYFAVFNSEYQLWEDASEVIKPGAFTESISGDVRALINHDTSMVLGRTKAGTLSLKQDERGLWGSVRINREDGDAMNLYARVQRGELISAVLALPSSARLSSISAAGNTAGKSRRSIRCTR